VSDSWRIVVCMFVLMCDSLGCTAWCSYQEVDRLDKCLSDNNVINITNASIYFYNYTFSTASKQKHLYR
jgi:hypothetical protein